MGQPGLPRRWVRVREPKGGLAPRASCATGPHERPEVMVRPFVHRWTLATTCAASRTHLGLDTPRPWSAQAIARTTPGLFGLSSVTALRAQALSPDGHIPVQTTAWYAKSHATFAEVLAAVRQPFWGTFNYSTSAHAPDL
jgi:hypothetical protein